MIRNILAVIVGLVVGSAVNMFFITSGPALIPPPEGVDVTTIEGLEAGIHLFELKHFISPFLAHALGTLVGALVAFSIAASHKSAMAYTVTGFFLVGGIANTFLIPAPIWFIVVDLLLAYIPMGYLAVHLLGKKETA